MNKSTIIYTRNDNTHKIKSWYDYTMCLYVSSLASYYPIRVIKRITNENITT